MNLLEGFLRRNNPTRELKQIQVVPRAESYEVVNVAGRRAQDIVKFFRLDSDHSFDIDYHGRLFLSFFLKEKSADKEMQREPIHSEYPSVPGLVRGFLASEYEQLLAQEIKHASTEELEKVKKAHSYLKNAAGMFLKEYTKMEDRRFFTDEYEETMAKGQNWVNLYSDEIDHYGLENLLNQEPPALHKKAITNVKQFPKRHPKLAVGLATAIGLAALGAGALKTGIIRPGEQGESYPPVPIATPEEKKALPAVLTELSKEGTLWITDSKPKPPSLDK